MRLWKRKKHGIENPEVIDIISLTPDSDVIEIHMVQTVEWGGKGDQVLLIQDKLNAYLNFLLSGQLAEQAPAHAELPWRIVLFCQSEPPLEVRDFVEKAAPVAAESGGEFTWRMTSAAADS
ncbi:DUF6572 domain-containing protein [Planotetraspora kaengkrachanensis]|uniref:Uncharacterized protein n=1 Tax=Planotetraspora kaengkrachanensis TaxID=575193 RepID=A0A8J3M6G0_9ACTN|nr:DUF6572 domain-containing protein [Planotetraspora kaengkrachanensis]GIG80364.1 hypothetical protein Pka01_34910 [Planotetraspora kaengkrachanensis]